MTNNVAVLPRARGRGRGLYVALALLLMLPSLMPIAQVAGRWLGAQIAVIVRGAGHDDTIVRNAVRDVGGHVTRSIRIIDGVAATVPADAVATLRQQPGIREVTPDAPIHLQTIGNGAYDPATNSGSMYSTTAMTGAQAYWSAGFTGKGVDVAVIDSGAVPVDGLRGSGKLVYGPDVSFESQSASVRDLDTFGHGTHMAGIIAGRASAAVSGAYAGDSTNFLGMAPDARVVSVKVADSHGLTDISQVLAGIDWVIQHHADPGFNIRVVNMSFGTDSYQNYVYDPLAYAAEEAWHAGIVVAAATGNSGWKTGVLDPADDPYVIAVGAYDASTQGLAPFSAGGDGNRNPDIVAPGAHIISLRDPGSFIDQSNPTARVATNYFVGSGTSQATAVVSGAAALLLSQNPLLTPDQVKNLLTTNATSLAGVSSQLQGAGEINLRGALTSPLTGAVQVFAPSTGTGSLEGARGSGHLSMNGVTLQGSVDIFGSPVNTSAIAQPLLNGTVWTGGVFNGVAWTGDGWGTLTTGDGWAGSAWNNTLWTASSWSGNQWSGNQWSGNQWSGNQWSGNQWSGNQWSGNQWSSASWS